METKSQVQLIRSQIQLNNWFQNWCKTLLYNSQEAYPLLVALFCCNRSLAKAVIDNMDSFLDIAFEWEQSQRTLDLKKRPKHIKDSPRSQEIDVIFLLKQMPEIENLKDFLSRSPYHWVDFLHHVRKLKPNLYNAVMDQRERVAEFLGLPYIDISMNDK